ncbi:MAG TPA: helix-turn-helix transcriptional regulator [Pseudonocardiaceae bacterium]|nr:helix-turn-helix transcriptional regulator [Pseudonocardiaceae bacterium]
MDAEEASADDRTIGRRLRQIRNARNKTLVVVAGLAGMSKSHLQRIETGEIALDRRSEIVALARALEVAPSELTSMPMPAPANGHQDTATIEIRHVLQAVIVRAVNGQVQTTEQLSARVRAIGELRQRCAYREMGAALPSLIADLHTSIAGGRDDARLLHLAVLLHVLGTQTYLHIVRAPDDLRLVAASLANDAAERLGDPVSLGVAAFGFSNVLLASGSFVLADTVVRRAGVTPGADAELAGMLALSTSLTAAADRRPAEVAAALDYAADLAGHTGEGNRFFLSFGPTNVTLWRIGAALEAGDYARTVSLAETVTPERIRASSRRAGYWMSYGRALARIRRREQEAVLALRRAETISPDEARRNPFVREVLAQLRGRVRRDSPAGRELQKMAHRFGLPV